VAVWDGEERNDVKYCKKGETAQEIGKIGGRGNGFPNPVFGIARV
jgi:hypothetical protein